MIRLRYGNTNTFYIPGKDGGLLVDTGYAGTLPAFRRCLKAAGLKTGDISWVLATHWHPDHMGLVGELMRYGIKLLLPDVQQAAVHFSDGIFERDGLDFVHVDESAAVVLPCSESRSFLAGMGIAGEIIHTPSHSGDSITLILDDGDCFVGDLEPRAYLQAYGENEALKKDWDRILPLHPKRVFYAHRPEEELS